MENRLREVKDETLVVFLLGMCEILRRFYNEEEAAKRFLVTAGCAREGEGRGRSFFGEKREKTGRSFFVIVRGVLSNPPTGRVREWGKERERKREIVTP